MEILKIIIWPLVALLGWMFTIYLLRNRIRSASFDKSKGKGEIKMSNKSDKFNDEFGDASMSVSIPDKTVHEIKQLKNREIVENVELHKFEKDQKYFKFSKNIERSLVPNDSAEKRRIRFRLGIRKGIPEIININIYSYFVITKIIRHENNIGWGSNWPQMKINKEYIPFLEEEDYWSISHDIDSNNYDSPLKLILNDENVINLSIAIYAIGNLIDGKMVYGSHRYTWDNENCKFGSFRLKKINEEELPYEAFDEIVPEIPEKGTWPNLK